MQYDFDSVIERRNTNSVKWDSADQLFNVEDILPMWVADMDFRSPRPVIDALKDLTEQGIFGYSTVPQSYYDAVINWMKKRHNWTIDREWIVLTCGVVSAIYVLIRTFASPGDHIIVQTPAYYPFFGAIQSNDCEILDNPMVVQNGLYTVDFEDLKKKVDSRTRIIILCSPHNPVGRVWRKEELVQLGQFCLEHNILVIADEIHCDIVYDGFEHIPFASINDDFAQNSITCTGASKTFNLPGMKTSNIIIPNPELREKYSAMLRSSGVNSPNMFGIAATGAAYSHGEPWLEQLLVYPRAISGSLKNLLQRRLLD